MVMVEIGVDEENEMPLFDGGNVVRAAGRCAVAAYTVGLRVGDMALVTDALGYPDVACSLYDEIKAALASEEAVNSAPVKLLAQYAFVLAADDVENCFFHGDLYKIASRVLTASLPCPLHSTSRAAKQALGAAQENWLGCIRGEVTRLVTEMAQQINIIAIALSESDRLSSDEIQQLLARVCTQRLAA